MKYLWILFLSCSFFNQVYSATIVAVENKTEKSILLSTSKNILNSLEEHYTVISLENNEKISLSDAKKFIFENNVIEVKDTEITCAWLSFWGHTKDHGSGLSFYLNKQKIGTICATKTHFFSSTPFAKIIIYIDYASNINFHFQNDGWWPNESVFPSELHINSTYSLLNIKKS